MTHALLVIISGLLVTIVFLAREIVLRVRIYDLAVNKHADEWERRSLDRFTANYGIAELERYRQAIRHAGFLGRVQRGVDRTQRDHGGGRILNPPLISPDQRFKLPFASGRCVEKTSPEHSLEEPT